MSSEAAYFPDALATREDVREAAACESESHSKHSEGLLPEPVLAGPMPSSLSTTGEGPASDGSLLEEVGRGSKDALELLFRRHARAVRNIAFRILRDHAEADDLVQDVFLFLFRKAAQFDARRGTADTWIIHVAYHRAFDRRRYLISRHFYATRELEDLGSSLADPRQDLAYFERSIEGVLGREVLVECQTQLTAQQRETLQLFFFEGYALKEIAERTGRSLVNVRSYYYRGLERLRRILLPTQQRSK